MIYIYYYEYNYHTPETILPLIFRENNGYPPMNLLNHIIQNRSSRNKLKNPIQDLLFLLYYE